MNSIWLVLAISAPSVLVAVVLAMLLLKRKAQERRAVERLLAAVKSAEADYRQALQKRFTPHPETPDPAATQAVERLVKQRRGYFKQLLAALLDRNPDSLLKMEPALQQFGDAHLQLLGKFGSGAKSEPVSEVSSEAGASVAAAAVANASQGEGPLRSENDRLRREVGLTLSALNNIFAEYASMFGDEHTRRDMSLEEILHSMQQLAAGEPAAPIELAAGAEENRPLTAVEPSVPEPAAEEADDPRSRASRASDPFAEPQSKPDISTENNPENPADAAATEVDSERP